MAAGVIKRSYVTGSTAQDINISAATNKAAALTSESEERTKEETGKLTTPKKVLTSLTAGAAAGAVAKTTIAP
ncbi:hypothetical protein X975_11443, partial [Stegodyphus mimosarum]